MITMSNEKSRKWEPKNNDMGTRNQNALGVVILADIYTITAE